MTDTFATPVKSRDELLIEWQEAKKQLDHYKEVEKQLRDQISESVFPDKQIGTNTVELGNGWKAKLVAGQTFNVTGSYDEVMDVEEKLPERISELLFKWSAKLDKRTYDSLPDDEKRLVNEVITIKDKAPTFSIVPPKVKA